MDHAPEKACSKCKVVQPLRKGFHRNRSRLDGFEHRCKSCKASWDIERLYGLTPQQHKAMLERQGGVCAICEGHETSHRKSLAIDHDHVSGVVRGILCAACNKSIGAFKDRPVLMMRAALYLLEHAEGSTHENDSDRRRRAGLRRSNKQ